MTAEQIRVAVLNHHRPPRTHGAKVRDALAHVRRSRREKPGFAGRASQIIGQMTITGVTREE